MHKTGPETRLLFKERRKTKMKKRVAALLVSMCLIICLIPVTVLADDDVISGTCGEDAQYYIEDGILYITGTGAIDDMAFMAYMYGMSGDGEYITTCEITDIVISDGITSIGFYAFLSLYALKTVVIEGSPNIGSYAFADCPALESVTINGTDAVVNSYAFESCINLSEVYIAGGQVAENAFDVCNSLSEIKGGAEVADGAITAGFYSFNYLISGEGYCVIYAPEGYEFKSAALYSDSDLLTELTEGSDYTVSRDGTVFTISIDDSVTENLDDGDYYFRFYFEIDGETEYTEIYYTAPDSVYAEFTDGVLTIWANYDAWLEYDEIIEQLEGVDLSEVTTICLGANLCWISPLIFSSCENLESVTFTDDYGLITWEIPYDTFSVWCNAGLYLDESGILYYIYEDLVTWEDGGVVYSCSLEVIWVPVGTTTLVLDSALTGVTSGSLYSAADTLTEIYFTGDAPSFDSDAFEGITATVYYPEGNETWTEDVLQDYGYHLFLPVFEFTASLNAPAGF